MATRRRQARRCVCQGRGCNGRPGLQFRTMFRVLTAAAPRPEPSPVLRWATVRSRERAPAEKIAYAGTALPRSFGPGPNRYRPAPSQISVELPFALGCYRRRPPFEKANPQTFEYFAYADAI